MSVLLDYQRAIAKALVSGDTRDAAALIDPHNQPSARLNIHRNTMLKTLANALALTYPVVQALVGEAFFSQAAQAYVQCEPPGSALLSLYGGTFPDFLAAYKPAKTLPYLCDVARLEWVVEYALQGHGDYRSHGAIRLGRFQLTFAPSLTLLKTHYPARPIWRAVLDEDIEALGRIDMSPVDTFLAVWLQGEHAAVTSLSAVAGAFLANLHTSGDVGNAIDAALAADPGGDPIAAIANEVLQSEFAKLTPSGAAEERSVQQYQW